MEYSSGYHADAVSAQARRIESHLGTGRSLCVLEGEPILYLLTRSTPPTRYVFLPLLMDPHFSGVARVDYRQEFRSILQRAPACVLLDGDPRPRALEFRAMLPLRYQRVELAPQTELVCAPARALSVAPHGCRIRPIAQPGGECRTKQPALAGVFPEQTFVVTLQTCEHPPPKPPRRRADTNTLSNACSPSGRVMALSAASPVIDRSCNPKCDLCRRLNFVRILCLFGALVFGCGGRTISPECVIDADCPAGKHCAGGACTDAPAGCSGAQAVCNGNCVNLSNDANHCGACDHSCGDGFVCADSECQSVCSNDDIWCDGRCTSPLDDPENCGTCGKGCQVGAVCRSGTCRCAAGYLDCGGRCVLPADDAGTCKCQGALTLCTAGCVDLLSDPDNCGSCGRTCGSGLGCISGDCACPAGKTFCNDGCRDLTGDHDNCGSCGTVCPDELVCWRGICNDRCGPFQTLCNGSCAALFNDPQNCGACGYACGFGQTCTRSECTCAVGYVSCGNSCIDPLNDDKNCGACGLACRSGQRCTAGTCACPQGDTDCGGTCIDLTSDSRNCGACGTVCAKAEACFEGRCRCGPGTYDCGGSCVDVLSDVNNCGGCGKPCPGSQNCTNGTCHV
jgi:hypothetical protein